MSDERYQDELRAFGRKLRELRLDQNLTQLDLELKAGVNRAEISKLENAQKNVELYTIVKLAEGLSIPLSTFFPVSKKKEKSK